MKNSQTTLAKKILTNQALMGREVLFQIPLSGELWPVFQGAEQRHLQGFQIRAWGKVRGIDWRRLADAPTPKPKSKEIYRFNHWASGWAPGLRVVSKAVSAERDLLRISFLIHCLYLLLLVVIYNYSKFSKNFKAQPNKNIFAEMLRILPKSSCSSGCRLTEFEKRLPLLNRKVNKSWRTQELSLEILNEGRESLNHTFRKESSLDLARHVTQSGGEVVKSFRSQANQAGIFWEVHLPVNKNERW